MSYRNIFAALTLGSALALGTAATAQNYFGNQMALDMDANTINLSVVTAEADGYVVVYDFTGGEIGEKLGEAPIQAGANANVQIGLNGTVVGDVMAVLFQGEMMEGADPMTGVAMLEIDVDNT